MSIWERIHKIDARIIYSLVIIAVAIPLIKPIGLPMKIMPTTKQVYDAIEALPEGSRVYLSIDYGPGSGPELDPHTQALLTHFFRKGLKVYIISTIPDGPMVAQINLQKFEKTGKYVYGRDYVNLGYFAGGESGLVVFAQDIRKVLPRDYKGTPVDQIPMMQGVNKITDFALGVTVNTGPGGAGTPDVWVRQIPIVYKTPLILALAGSMTPQSLPYLQAKQIAGLLGGLRPAAEYELLLKEPSIGVAAMDAQSAAHSVILLFILLGNIAYLTTRKKRVL